MFSSDAIAVALWPVPCAATRMPCFAREVDRTLDVLSRLGKGDGGGALVGREVPCSAGFVPSLVAFGEDLP